MTPWTLFNRTSYERTVKTMCPLGIEARSNLKEFSVGSYSINLKSNKTLLVKEKCLRKD